MKRYSSSAHCQTRPITAARTLLHLVQRFSLASLMMLSACGGEETTGPTQVQSVAVTPATATLTSLGATVKLTAAAHDADGGTLSGKTISWSTSDQEIATVDASGTVTAVENGVASITATTDGVRGTAQVTVSQAASTFTLNHDAAEFIAIGQSFRIYPTAQDANGNVIWRPTITWVSSDADVVTVDTLGLVTATGNGSAVITATSNMIVDSSVITVDQMVTSINVSPDTIELSVGETARFTATPLDMNGFAVAGEHIAWTTADSTVASVDSSGLVTAVGKRLGPITVLAGAEGRTGRSTADVTVSFASIYTGFRTTCALTDGGVAYCWGSNNTYMLGDSTSISESRPLAVSGGLTFTDMAIGFSHTCGVSTDGAAYCWGSSRGGALGIGSISYEVSAHPTPVEGNLQFESLTASLHTCGITTSGTAYCWGENHSAQLGDSSLTNKSIPVPVRGGRSFRVLNTGIGGASGTRSHTCGLDVDNHAYCWGANNVGQLGTNVLPLNERCTAGTYDTQCSSIPVPPDNDLELSIVYVGGSNTCGLTADGEAYCWGWLSAPEYTVPTKVSGEISFAKLAIAGSHRCGIANTGAVYCWGSNLSGQLGNGSDVDSESPRVITGGRFYTLVSTAAHHTCGLTNTGQLYCWGSGTSGQIGNGRTDSKTRVPTLVYGSRR